MLQLIVSELFSTLTSGSNILKQHLIGNVVTLNKSLLRLKYIMAVCICVKKLN